MQKPKHKKQVITEIEEQETMNMRLVLIPLVRKKIQVQPLIPQEKGGRSTTN